MQAHSSDFSSTSFQAWSYRLPGQGSASWLAGPNDGGVKRGDREDTGDNQADVDEIGSGPAEATVDPTSLGGGSSIGQPGEGGFDSEEELGEVDGLEIMRAEDGRLGITGLPGNPSEDWAADSGETKNPAGE